MILPARELYYAFMDGIEAPIVHVQIKASGFLGT